MNDYARGRRGLWRAEPCDTPRRTSHSTRVARQTCRQSGGLAVLVAAGALGLAACGGSPGSAQVASLGKASASAPAPRSSASPSGDATELMNQWTACMRGNGDPNQAVPTIDVSKVIKIIIPAGYMGTIDGPSGQDPSGAGVTCQSYLTAAQAALNGGQAPQQPSAAQLETWSECMRANGVSDYPDLGTGAGTVSGSPGSGGGFLNNPAFQHASQVCQQKTGLDIGNPGTGDSKPGQIEIYTSTGQLKLMSL